MKIRFHPDAMTEFHTAVAYFLRKSKYPKPDPEDLCSREIKTRVDAARKTELDRFKGMKKPSSSATWPAS